MKSREKAESDQTKRPRQRGERKRKIDSLPEVIQNDTESDERRSNLESPKFKFIFCKQRKEKLDTQKEEPRTDLVKWR
jgi:hypothetical protein